MTTGYLKKKTMKIIPVKLPNKNASIKCLVDDEDYEGLSKFKWHLCNGYPTRATWKKHFKMHRQIMNAKPGTVIDHINRNKMDNRKSNLRFCTPLVNKRNLSLYRNNKTGVAGVSVFRRDNLFVAMIRVMGRQTYLGRFATLEEAAKARKKGELFYWGDNR